MKLSASTQPESCWIEDFRCRFISAGLEKLVGDPSERIYLVRMANWFNTTILDHNDSEFVGSLV
jgi:hypothetical protein